MKVKIRSSRQLGQLLKAARQQKKLSQRTVAHELGVTQSWLSRVEQGREKARIGQLLRLATWLGLELTGELSRTANRNHERERPYPSIDEIVTS